MLVQLAFALSLLATTPAPSLPESVQVIKPGIGLDQPPAIERDSYFYRVGIFRHTWRSDSVVYTVIVGKDTLCVDTPPSGMYAVMSKHEFPPETETHIFQSVWRHEYDDRGNARRPRYQTGNFTEEDLTKRVAETKRRGWHQSLPVKTLARLQVQSMH